MFTQLLALFDPVNNSYQFLITNYELAPATLVAVAADQTSLIDISENDVGTIHELSLPRISSNAELIFGDI